MFKRTILGTLTALFVFSTTSVYAETRFSTSTRPLLRERTTNEARSASSTKMVDSACAKTAVDVRKTSLVSIYAKFASSVSTTLSTREDSVRASFDLSTKKARQDARTAARSTYKKAVKEAFETLKTTEKSTMKTYASSIKACGGKNSEASDEISDGSIADSVK